MFETTQNKGFKITFGNGVTVSVQFGPGNYCQHYDTIFSSRTLIDAPAYEQQWESTDAEIASWNSEGGWHNFDCDQVKGYLSPDEVLAFMVSAAAYNTQNDDGKMNFDSGDKG